MKVLVDWYFKAIELILVLCLAAMCLMVFGNVVLRHFFDSGINVSEELSRFMFIWLTFLGAIVTMREGSHIGMDMLVRRLPGRLQFAVTLLAQGLILACCAVFLWGLCKQYALHVANTGLVTGISMVIVYAAAYLCAASIGVMVLANMVRLAAGRARAATMIVTSTEELGRSS